MKPTAPPPCRYCDAPSTQLLGIVPVCDGCAPAVKEIRARNLETMLTFLRDVAKQSPVTDERAA